MTTQAQAPKETALYDAAQAAALRGDGETADRYWREFVYLLWKPMEQLVPWTPKKDATPPRDSVTAARSRESTTSNTATE